MIRNYGIKGLQAHIREGVRLAQKFEDMLRSDRNFEIAAERHLGLVVFRLAADNQLTEILLKRLNSRGKVHCVPAALKSKYVIRFVKLLLDHFRQIFTFKLQIILVIDLL